MTQGIKIGSRVRGTIQVFTGTAYEPREVTGTVTKKFSALRVCVRWDHDTEPGALAMVIHRKLLELLAE